jgi:uncharacterized protein (DUF2141 family)
MTYPKKGDAMLTKITLFLIALTMVACGTADKKSGKNMGQTEPSESNAEANVAATPVVPKMNEDTALLEDATSLVLKVVPRGLKPEGKFCVSVFDNKEAFPDKKDGSTYAACRPIGESSAGVEIVGLKRGVNYAIAVFHDKNSNGKLDTKKILTFDAPAEGFGFSKNPGLNRFGPPTFGETALSFGTPRAETVIDILYLF